jgi:uncharacterized protein (DUF983 family)
MQLQNQHRMGTGGRCICPKCGEKVVHQAGIPCQQERCPACGAKMMREGSYHHQLLRERKQRRQEL